MFVQLGTQPAVDRESIVALLLECHVRIRSFTALACGLAQAPRTELAAAAERVHRYFSQALPLHVRDEEESLAPRLRGKEPPLDRALERLEAQHLAHRPLLEELLAHCESLMRNPAELPTLAAPLARVTARLTDEFEEHLALEETEIFPALTRLVDAGAQAAMVRELRQRRAVR